MQRELIKDLAEQIRGVSYKPEDLHKDLNEDSVILLRANNIDNGMINFDDVVYVDKSKVSQDQYLKTGDILICASSGSKQLVGKAASIEFDKPCTFGAFCKVVRPRNGWEKYLGAFFQSDIYRQRISALSIGANINNIRNEHIDSLVIPLHTEELRKSAIKEIDLLNRIIRKRKTMLQSLDLLIKARFIEMFGDPISNTKGWNMVELGELTGIGSSKRIFEKEYVSEGIPFYRTKEIVELSKGNNISTELYISEERFAEIKEQYGVPKAGDLLISAVGTIGIIWIVDGKNDFYFKDGNLIRVDGSDTFDSIYMKNLLEHLISEYKKQMSSGTAYAALTISGMTKMKVYDVPLNLQVQFSDFVKQVDKSKVVVPSKIKNTIFAIMLSVSFGQITSI